MKTCSNKRCLMTNPQSFEQFNKELHTPDGYSYQCRNCRRMQREVRRNNPTYKAREIESDKKRRDEIHQIVRQFRDWIKIQLPCKNCRKWFDKHCMEFDHLLLVRDHSAQRLATKTGMLLTYLKELLKTQLLCGSCHNLRTAQQRECKWNLKEAA